MGELLAEYDVLGAFWMTIRLTAVSALGALVLGTVVAVMRVSPVGVLRAFGTAYVTLVRNTPLTLIVFFCAFGFYITLQYRIGAQDSPIAAELPLGCSGSWSTMPRSWPRPCAAASTPCRRAKPRRPGQSAWTSAHPDPGGATAGVSRRDRPLGNVLIALTKNTTVVATIGVAEASYLMKGMIEFRPDLIYAIFVIMATGFVVLTLPIGVLFTSLSRRLAVRR